MGLDDLEADLEREYADLDGVELDLDRETRQELAMLSVATDAEDPQDLLRRAVHLLFQTAVDTGKMDFHLRSAYDVTYDEYLMGVTMDAYDEQQGFPQPETNDDRRYQF